MPNERFYCIICANSHTEEDGKVVMSELFVCNKCSRAILELHLFTNPIKWLCPHCRGASGSSCIYCDLRIMVRKASSVK